MFYSRELEMSLLPTGPIEHVSFLSVVIVMMMMIMMEAVVVNSFVSIVLWYVK